MYMDPRIDQLREHLREEPNSRRFFQLGELLRKGGELEQAIGVFAEGLEIHPQYVAAWVSLGRTQVAAKRWVEAERAFAHGLQLDPENAVAARMIGEVAEASGDYERALKAFQLALALTPGDAELIETIERIEAQLRGETTAPMAFDPSESNGGAVEAFPEDEPFSSMPASMPTSVEVDDSPFAAGPPPVRARPSLIADLPSGDPFAVTTSRDTGVWELADDVFMTTEAAEEVASSFELDTEQTTEPEVFGDQLRSEATNDVFAEEAIVDEPVVEMQESLPEPFAEPDPEPEFEPEPEPLQEMGPDPEPVPDVPVEPLPFDEAPEAIDDEETLPMHTVTLARLAADQGDVALARETLEGLLAKEPDNVEARELLLSFDGPPPVEIEVAPDPEESMSKKAVLAAKTSALKSWMEALRLAADRRAP